MTGATGIISGVSVSHERASVDTIEAAAAPSQRAAVADLLAAGADEAFALQTCNRVEFYVVTDGAETGRSLLAEWVADVPDAARRDLDHETALRHLLRVAAGLESLVLGEDQILGQVRTAHEDARAAGGIGGVLEDALLKAIRVGERARDETAINEGVVSLGSAAVELARRERDLSDATALVVGAGEMGQLAAKAFDDAVARLVVANRTVPHAEHLAETVAPDARAVGLDDLAAAAADADVVVSATGSPGPVLDREALAAAEGALVIDIAQPRDVAPAARDLPDVEVRDIDALETVTEETRERRQDAAREVEAIVDAEFERLLDQYKRKRADEVIGAMYEGAERMKAREVGRALTQLEHQGEFTDEQRETVEAMADALVNQLLAPPTESLREAAEHDDWSTIHAALELFGPSLELGEAEIEVPPAVAAGTSPDDIPAEMRQQMPDAVLEQLAEDD